MDMNVLYGGFVVNLMFRNDFVWVMNVILIIGLNILSIIYDWGFFGVVYDW